MYIGVKMEKKRRTILSRNETAIFLDVWRSHLEELRSCRRNSHVLADICNDMKEYQVFLSSEEARTRIQNLTKKYRMEKVKCGKSGGTPSEWEFYSVIHEMLGKFKYNRVDELVDESIDIPSSASGQPLNECSESTETASPDSFSDDGLAGPSVMSTSTSSDSRSRPKRKKEKEESSVKQLLNLAERETVAFEKYVEKANEANDRHLALLERIATCQEKILHQLSK